MTMLGNLYLSVLRALALNTYLDRVAFLPAQRELRSMMEAFAPISGRFQIYTFCDSISTFSGKLLGLGDAMTYCLGLPNEELVHMDATHQSMTKLSHVSADYQKILAILKRAQRSYGFAIDVGDWGPSQLFRPDELER
jgi:hypothetical protein